MKKTDTCYYMSITKEENSAFVVANHQGGGSADPTQVVVDSKTEGSTMGTGSASVGGAGATPITSTTPTATLSANVAAAAAAGSNGTSSSSIGHGAIGHQRYSNCCNATCDTSRAQGPQGDARIKARISAPTIRAPLPPPVILQVLPSTPTLQHHNLLASDVHRECRMRLGFL